MLTCSNKCDQCICWSYTAPQTLNAKSVSQRIQNKGHNSKIWTSSCPFSFPYFMYYSWKDFSSQKFTI